MKKVFLSLIVAMVATISMSAQQIAVVKGDVTKVYTTLKDAIEGAEDGSVVYLPGGGFPIADDIKITKKLTIIGISHTASSDNVDGRTAISGNLFFDEGSSGSALMGCRSLPEIWDTIMPGVQKSARNLGHHFARCAMTVSKLGHEIARCAETCPRSGAYK
jgi:hypothetical protein